MTTYIYTRVSTDSQNSTAQLEELKRKHPYDYIADEVFSGTTTDRPKFSKLVSDMVSGDTLIVREVSRLGRNTAEVLTLCNALKARGISIVVDNLGIDITTPAGSMVLTVLAGAAQMERELMLERQAIGIAKAKAEGKYTGRKAVDPVVIKTAKGLIQSGMSKRAVAKQMNIGESTLYKYLKMA